MGVLWNPSEGGLVDEANRAPGPSRHEIRGYSTAQLSELVLRQCGDNLTRENILK